MAGSLMGSHTSRPTMGSSRRAKAAAASAREDTRYGTDVAAGIPLAAVQEPEVVLVPPPAAAPPRRETANLADNLTMFLGTIFCDGHKNKDQFDTRYK
jgi:hypothetical protein